MENKYKINVFALPSQTSLLLFIIVTVIIGAIIAGSFGQSPILIWPLAFGLIFLSLRSFLSSPDNIKNKSIKAGDDFLVLKQEIIKLSNKIKLKSIPQLLIGTENSDIKVFGSFRRRYLLIPPKKALEWQKELNNPDKQSIIQASLIHELYHIKTGDYWKTEYAKNLLISSFLFMLWAIFVLSGLIVFLQLITPDFIQFDFSIIIEKISKFSPELANIFLNKIDQLKKLVQERYKTTNFFLVLHFTVNSLLPFIIVGFILWKLYLKKMLRMRELYADAGVVNTQKDILPIYSSITRIPFNILKKYPPVIINPKSTIWNKLKALNKNHPDKTRRTNSLINPNHIFDDWFDMAILVGSLVLILDIVLLGPLTMLYIGFMPMHFPTLACLIIISISLLPYIVQNKPIFKELCKLLAFIEGLRLVLLIILIGSMIIRLFVSPEDLNNMLSIAVASTSRFAGFSDNLGYDDLTGFLIQAIIFNIPQPFIMFVVLLMSLIFSAFITRRIFTWYSFPQAEKYLLKIVYIFFGINFLIVSYIMIPITTILLQTNYNIPMFFIVFIITIICGAMFVYYNNKYACYCPECKYKINGNYYIGKKCDSCDKLLHSWLIITNNENLDSLGK